MSRITIAVLRSLQVLLALASLGLSAYVIHWYLMSNRTTSPAPFNFIIFASIFSVISVILLEVVPRFAPRLSHPYVSIGIEVINTAFYFGGFIGLAVFITNLRFCRGTVCGCGRADTVFAAAQFTVWISTTALMAKDMFKKGSKMPSNINHEMRQA